METAIVSIICIALVVFGGMAMSNGFITSVDASTAGLLEAGDRNDNIMRTELSPISTNLVLATGPDPLEIILENNGQTKLADYDKWDIIIQYFDDSGIYHVQWLPYVPGTTSTYEWDIGWIKMNGQPEVFDPGVLNPGEQLQIKTILDPSVGENTTNMVVVSTSSGVTCSTYFSP
jgi:archaeal flagellar protein FlaF